MCNRFARCAILETYRMCSETFLNCSTLMHKFSMILQFFPIYHHFTFFFVFNDLSMFYKTSQ